MHIEIQAVSRRFPEWVSAVINVEVCVRTTDNLGAYRLLYICPDVVTVLFVFAVSFKLGGEIRLRRFKEFKRFVYVYFLYD